MIKQIGLLPSSDFVNVTQSYYHYLLFLFYFFISFWLIQISFK